MIKIRHYGPIAAALMLSSLIAFEAVQLKAALVDRELAYSEGMLRNLASRAQASLGRSFAADNQDGVRQVMSELYLFRRESEAFLLDEQGRVIASDHLGYEGSTLRDLPFPTDPGTVLKARTGLEGFVVRDKRDHAMVAYFPISASKGDLPPYSRRAVLIVKLSVRRGMDEVRDILVRTLIRSGAVIALLVGASWVTLNLSITQRVRRLVEVMAQYLAGDESARSREVGKDEIGEIAVAFNRLASVVAEKQAHIAASQQELQHLNQSLERRVLERTNALTEEVEERRRAEAALMESERELQTVLDLAPDPMVVINRVGVIRKYNRAAEALFGWTEAEALGQNVNILMPEPHHGAHDGYLAAYAATGQAKVIGFEREVEGVDRGGRLLPVALSVSKIELQGQVHYVGVVRDMRERKAAAEALAKAREKLLEAEKMAALGGLVAGVAHEINTPVGVGVTAVSHLQEEVARLGILFESGQMKRSDLEKHLTTCAESGRIIETNLTRASALIRNFKEIAVDQTADDPRVILVGDYIDQILSSLRPMIKGRPIGATASVKPVGLAVRLQPGGIAQIVTNLVTNSLKHGFIGSEAGDLGFEIRADGPDLLIDYFDTGRGMSAEVAARIFDPFFTTARGSGGSGLGMHIVYNLVTQKYGGEIRCESAPGRGTRFSIRIPDCAAPSLESA